MDRAGFVGDDGPVHHGFMDQSFLRPLPGIVLMAPSDERDLNRMLQLGLSLDTACALRYPRDSVPAHNFVALDDDDKELTVGKSRTLRRGEDATLIVYGALNEIALKAAERLATDGVEVEVIDARFCKPLDEAMLRRTLRDGHPVLTVEDHVVVGGFGAAVTEFARDAGLPTRSLTVLGHPADVLVAHAKRGDQLAEVGLDCNGIVASVRRAIGSTTHAAEVVHAG